MRTWNETNAEWKAFKKIHNLDNAKVAEMLHYKNARSFTKSSAYREVVDGLLRFYEATRPV